MTEPAPRAGAEAARLLVAAQQWLRGSAPHLAPVDADGEPCSCPLCRAVAAVRDADPDSVARWVDTAVSAVERVAAEAAATAGGASRSDGDGPGAPHADGSDDDQPAAADEKPEPADGAAPRRVRRIPLDGASTEDGGTGT